MIIQLGNFEVSSTQLVAADPGSVPGIDDGIIGTVEPVLPGIWVGEVKKTEVADWGEANAVLAVIHSSAAERKESFEWMKCPFIVRTSSGQAGLFDADQFRVSNAEAADANNSPETDWYAACCDLTENGEEAGVLDGGAVSRCGLGDGTFGVYKAVDEHDQVVGVKIVFIKE